MNYLGTIDRGFTVFRKRLNNKTASFNKSRKEKRKKDKEKRSQYWSLSQNMYYAQSIPFKHFRD
jgi:hypothetical protein